MTWLGQWAEWGWCISSSGPYRQDYSNRDEVSEWWSATPRQPHRDHVTWIRCDPTDPWTVGSLGFQRIQQDSYIPVSGTKDTNSI